MSRAALVVEGLSGSALLQDAGRTLRPSGVPTSGAFDRFAHGAATRLVGGGAADAALEVVGRLVVTASVAVTMAATGTARLLIDGVPAPGWTALAVAARQSVLLETAGTGYLAVAGGLLVEPALGSRSTCLLGPLGPAPLRVGDHLPLGQRPTSPTVGDFCRPVLAAGPIRVVPGPHLALSTTTVTVLEASRIGVRVRPRMRLRAGADLPSLGVLPGTIQVLPAGDWFVLGPDAGTMGGYPVAGVVVAADLGRLAHVAPGTCMDLRAISADAAPDPPIPEIVRLGRLSG